MRIDVDIPNSLDKIWKITVDKSDAQLPFPLREKLKSIIKNQPKKNIYILKSFDHMRKNMNFFNFDYNFFNNLGIFRQTKLGNILLKAGIILNRE